MIILDHKKIVNAIEKKKAVQCHSKFDILTLSIVLEANFWKQLDLDCLQTGLDLPPQAQDDDPKYSQITQKVSCSGHVWVRPPGNVIGLWYDN